MQQATTLHTSARARAAQSAITALATLALLVTAATAALSTRAPHSARIAAVVVNPGHNRLFDSERMYVPSVSAYVPLGETYASTVSAHLAPQPVFSSRMQADQQAAIPSVAEYGTLPWDENYRVPAQPAPAVAAPSLNSSSRLFADQRRDVVSAAHYAGLPFAVEESPAGTPR